MGITNFVRAPESGLMTVFAPDASLVKAFQKVSESYGTIDPSMDARQAVLSERPAQGFTKGSRVLVGQV